MMNLWIGVVLLLLGVSHSQGCGQKPFSARVVNGENAAPHAWPWQISLRVNGRHICGGSLIEDDWVVTAAHCVDRNPSPSGYTVVVGAHIRTGTTSVQQTFNLRQLFKHESFNMRELRNDIALLQLNGRVKLSDKVNTVCMPQPGDKVSPGSRCYITGWGRMVGGGQAASTLQQAVLPVADHKSCQSVNGYMVSVDEDSMVCAGGEGKGGCQGDSGGPFVCNEGGRWVLRGAVSWGHGKCRTDHYTVFARVSNFVDWIKQKQSSGGGGNGGGGGGGCSDRNPNCRHYLQYCRWDQNIRRLCPKSCRLC
ncbi:chymotrypsin-like protease CTRL-1 [Pocillopora verrucosa]|uniref:chymotrypsin-like protease CTRL-1 n=1 Tax=Pocillopora verrucosa TaxID=203993 RepID=UPI003342347F